MSVTSGIKYRWHLPQVPSERIHEAMKALSLSPVVIQTLFVRGYTDHTQMRHFLLSQAEDVVGDPSQLKDAERAVHRIMQAIEHQERILIVGDYDVDGITSAAMMMLCLLSLRARVNFFLPHRTRDGYGLSQHIVRRAAYNRYSVIVTVDNGISAHDAVDTAHELGVDVIITDHHQPHGTCPQAYAIVNPQQGDCAYPDKLLAGVGVTFKVLSLLFRLYNKQLPEKVYELLMLGTVADVVPLTGENRYWVRYGLACMNRMKSTAIQVLQENGNIERKRLSSIDIGFGIAPQINALGRLEDPREGVAFLIGNDTHKTRRVGHTLHELNQTRKRIEQDIVRDVQDDIERGEIDIEQERIIVASRSYWQPGVIGLAASRLVNTYQRPVLLFHRKKNGKLQGSCRSIQAFDIFNALTACSDVLDTFGGHAAAAGLSLSQACLPELKQRLEQRARTELSDDDFVPSIMLDACLYLDDMSHRLMHELSYLEPFGHKNERPLFYIPDVQILHTPRLLKEQHVKCTVTGHGTMRSVMFFWRPDIYAFLMNRLEKTFDIVGYIIENQWRGKVSLEVQGVDIRERRDDHND